MINCFKDLNISKIVIKKEKYISKLFGILLQKCNTLHIHEYAN